MALIRNSYGHGGDSPSSRRRRDERGRYMEQRYAAYDPYEDRMIDEPEDRRRMGFSSEYANMTVLPRYRYGLPFDSDEERERDRQQDIRDHENRKRQNHVYGGQGERIEPLTWASAQKWVRQMQNEDPQRETGECWTPEEAKEIAAKMGLPTEGEKMIEFYAVLNAMYSDYFSVAEKFDLIEDDFFAELAKAFLNDKDAVKNKVAMYYRCIAKKE